MQVIASDALPIVPAVLEGFDYPAILVSKDYRILATNARYEAAFGALPEGRTSLCYQVSHGYSVPCDQAGEDCPLAAALDSGTRQRVLHIHQTPTGRAHVDVELIPLHDQDGELQCFIELLKPVEVAGAEDLDHEMVGQSEAFNRMLGHITRVGPSEVSVLLLGESGTGKELAARAIHAASQRQEGALVTLECAGLTPTLFESELFGHVKGAFTGAHSTRRGLVESADGGTLFLDEIGDVPLELQVKLLRLIETGTFRPVGSTEVRRSNFRLICATHRDMASLVQEGAFRQDLYYRINVFPIVLPSLNERREDIPLLARSLLRRQDPEDRYVLTDSAIRQLRAHHYQGNIRELRNLISRAMVMADTHVIDGRVMQACQSLSGDSQPAEVLAQESGMPDLKTHEQRYFKALLAQCQGDKEQAARVAGISVRSLYRRLAEISEQ